MLLTITICILNTLAIGAIDHNLLLSIIRSYKLLFVLKCDFYLCLQYAKRTAKRTETAHKIILHHHIKKHLKQTGILKTKKKCIFKSKTYIALKYTMIQIVQLNSCCFFQKTDPSWRKNHHRVCNYK